MNSVNHFIAPVGVLYILFFGAISMIEIVLFVLIFGVLLDANQIFGKYLNKPEKHRRTWVEEPFGLIFIGAPIGIILSTIKIE